MIRVHKDWEKIPVGLSSSGAVRKRAQMLEEGASHVASDYFYRHDTVVEQLKILYHGKCGYCETEINAGFSGRVDHYRPRAHYFWLAYEWSNLVWSCERCNGRKSDQFPVHGPRVETPADNQEAWRADSLSFLSEQAVLLHPELDDPGDHVVFHPNGAMEARNGSVRGAETIRICGLDREDLILARKTMVDEFMSGLKDAVEDLWDYCMEREACSQRDYLMVMDGLFRSVLRRMHQAQGVRQVYARLGWHVWEEFERFFLQRLPHEQRLFVARAFERFAP